MRRFAAGLSQHPDPAQAVGEAAGEVLDGLGGEQPDLLVAFVSPHFRAAFAEAGPTLVDLIAPRAAIGTTAVAVAGGEREIEDGPALSLFAARLPDARARTVRLEAERVEDGFAVSGLPVRDRSEPGTLLLLADPFSFPVGPWTAQLAVDDPDLQVIGGLASAAQQPGGNALLADRDVHSTGAVGILIEGAGVRAVVSQGCRPVGTPLVVTKADGNVVLELAGRAALIRLQECAEQAGEEDRMLMRQGVHFGIVVDEHRPAFARGDFLVRNVVGAIQRWGAIEVAETIEVGQTVQFHVRDAVSADEDLRELLAGHTADGALLFTCNGRGRHLFALPDHDAGMVADLLGPLPLAGAFCAGEIGPIGGVNFLHGFTASLALF
jgi:small ligand-binding sensory domain FIST